MNNIELFDTHSHINFPDFNKDREDVVKRSLENGVRMIIIGTSADNSARAVEIANQYESGVYASVGLHPTDKEDDDFDINYYRGLAKNPKVVAIGECGLDYYHPQNYKEKQKNIFKKQIELATEVNKPLIIHCRDAHNDVLNILQNYFLNLKSGKNGVIHFFSGSWEQAQKYFNLGFLISFTGVITFPPLRRASTSDYDEIIKKAPLEKIILETDAPFVAPIPYRGQRNEPLYVKEVAQKIAEIKGISYEEAAKITTKNAVELFNLRGDK